MVQRFLFLLVAIGLSNPYPVFAQDAPRLVVPDYGAVSPAPDAANQPDPAINYRVVFGITKAASEPDQPNPSLVKVARFLNLLATHNIQPAKGNIVAIVHSPATSLVMTDAAYREKYQVANPTLPLIAALTSAGAQVHVCSQALHGQDIATNAVASGVTVDLSAMTTLATLQLQGFAVISD